jgi:acyl-CoA thioester hydrolase
LSERTIQVEEINDYPVKVEIPVAWGEMDSFGHVNNVYFFRYFETARIKYFESIQVLDIMKETGMGPILAETRCRYLKPVFYPDTLTVGVRIKSTGKTSAVMEYLVVGEKAGVAAAGSSVIVMINYNTSEKCEIPGEIREMINKIESGPTA